MEFLNLNFLFFIGIAQATTHHLLSGFFSGSNIVSLEYDDVTYSLSVKQNYSTNVNASGGSKWIALDQQRKNLYIAVTGGFQSYAIGANQSLEYKSSVGLPSSCSNANFIVGSSTAPFTVFGAPYSEGCSSLAISVDASGSLQSAFANLTYNSTAGIHGLALSPENDFIYSGDDMGDAVWTHSYDAVSGEVVEVQKLDAPSGANPRHLAVHPNGKWVYVVYEELNQIAVYGRDKVTGLLSSTNSTYSLIPSAFTNSSSYWADEVAFSIPQYGTSPKYLLASSRSRVDSAKGYVSAYALDVETGAISEQVFQLPTTGSGGAANSVSPAPFNEETFTITDSGANFVEVWRINGSSASTVSHLDLPAGPANVLWV